MSVAGWSQTDAARRVPLEGEWDDGLMTSTGGALLRRRFLAAALALTFLAAWATTVGATSVTTTTRAPSAASLCGVVASPSVHVVSSSPTCVITVRHGVNVRIRLRAGMRWGYPVSNSRAVNVNDITRDSIGVVAATLHAAAVGRATIHDTGTEYCKSGQLCPDLALLWTLKVIVTK